MNKQQIGSIIDKWKLAEKKQKFLYTVAGSFNTPPLYYYLITIYHSTTRCFIIHFTNTSNENDLNLNFRSRKTLIRNAFSFRSGSYINTQNIKCVHD